jgi:hypothetical protein
MLNVSRYTKPKSAIYSIFFKLPLKWSTSEELIVRRKPNGNVLPRCTLVFVSKVKLPLSKKGVRRKWQYISPFLTSAMYEGEWLASRPGHFAPAERAQLLIEYGWTPESVWTFWKRQKSLSPTVNGVIF